MAEINFETGEIKNSPEKRNIYKKLPQNYMPNIKYTKKSSIGESKSIEKREREEKSSKGRKYLEHFKKRMGIYLIIGIFITAGATLGPKMVEKYNTSILENNIEYYFEQFNFEYEENGYKIYRDDWTADYIAENEQFDFDTLMYFKAASYDFYPEKHMKEVFKYLKQYNTKNGEMSKQFASYEDYYRNLGYNSFAEYLEDYNDTAMQKIEEMAKEHADDPSFPIRLNSKTGKYEITDERITYNRATQKYEQTGGR